MASSICLSLSRTSKTLTPPFTSTNRGCICSLAVSVSNGHIPTRRKRQQVVSMAPEEEKLTRRNPLDFPIDDIFPQFSPMKTPLPPPMPYDPPEEDEEEEEKKEEEEEEEKKEEEEEEEDLEEEEPETPEKQS